MGSLPLSIPPLLRSVVLDGTILLPGDRFVFLPMATRGNPAVFVRNSAPRGLSICHHLFERGMGSLVLLSHKGTDLLVSLPAVARSSMSYT